MYHMIYQFHHPCYRVNVFHLFMHLGLLSLALATATA